MVSRILFRGDADYEALQKAQDWCDENGYSYGNLQADAPIGLLFGEFEISKWRNMSSAERKALDGTMDAPGRTYRKGPVIVTLKEK